MIKGAIFDFDGTLFNSMHIWNTISENYLRSIGYEAKENLHQTVKNMSLMQAAIYYKSEYKMRLSVDEIMNGVNKMLEHYYINEVQLKSNALSFLKELNENNVKMCIATANEHYQVEAALERCGIKNYFSKIFTCTSVGYGKDKPVIYREALKHLQIKKNETIVFEDALYAIKTAKLDGFITVAVYDDHEEQQGNIKRLADYYISDYGNTEDFWKFASAL